MPDQNPAVSSQDCKDIFKDITKLGSQISKTERFFSLTGSLENITGALIRVVFVCLLCGTILGVTLSAVDEKWLSGILFGFIVVLSVTFFVEVVRAVIIKFLRIFFKITPKDIFVLILTAILAMAGASLFLLVINSFNIPTMLTNKAPLPLIIASFILSFLIMGTIILYTRLYKMLNRTLEELQEIYFETVCVISNAIDIKDPYTWGHSARVILFAYAIASELNLSKRELDMINIAARFHDVGKIGVPEEILRKPSSNLSDEEWSRIKEHPKMSARILEPLKGIRDCIPFVKHHHEKFNGAGYPEGLKGDNIPEGAQIIALADALDAMTSTRSYRKALSSEEAKEEILSCSGTQFNPRLIEVFKKVWGKGLFKDNKEV
jgi:hypothetical protein